MMIEAADTYIIERNLPYESRFDIISIIKGSNNHSLEHVTDAFNGLTG
jgi:putative endonuclease